jgi:hypothetical protein
LLEITASNPSGSSLPKMKFRLWILTARREHGYEELKKETKKGKRVRKARSNVIMLQRNI